MIGPIWTADQLREIYRLWFEQKNKEKKAK